MCDERRSHKRPRRPSFQSRSPRSRSPVRSLPKSRSPIRSNSRHGICLAEKIQGICLNRPTCILQHGMKYINCKKWITGNCIFGTTCAFKHDPARMLPVHYDQNVQVYYDELPNYEAPIDLTEEGIQERTQAQEVQKETLHQKETIQDQKETIQVDKEIIQPTQVQKETIQPTQVQQETTQVTQVQQETTQVTQVQQKNQEEVKQTGIMELLEFFMANHEKLQMLATILGKQ